MRLLGPLTTEPDPHPDALYLLALIADRQQNSAAAINLTERVLSIVDSVHARLLLARAHQTAGNVADALDSCDRVLAQEPSNVSSQILRGSILEQAGRVAEARDTLAPLILGFQRSGTTPPHELAFEWAKVLTRDEAYDEAIAYLDGILASGVDDERRRITLHLKAKACDRAARYADAIEAAREANNIGELDFDPALYEQQVSALMAVWSRDALRDFPRANCDSQLPVFIAGMPRSGTSLVDRIIDAHPEAIGVGELDSIERFAIRLAAEYDPTKPAPDCFGQVQEQQWSEAAESYIGQLRAITPSTAERIVNKALGNNKLVGLIAQLFPRTRVIHVIRDPRDVAVSCFMGGFNHAVHPWTTRIDWCLAAWQQSTRLMNHWKETLDIPILDVRYEDLVRHPSKLMPRIVEFIGLEWNDACTRFHESGRTIRTLSYDQVTRPLYDTSVGRHRNYPELFTDVDIPPYP